MSSTMAFINRSVCLYCKTSSQIEAEKEFHDIFDEVGLDLQLPSLVEKFFKVNVASGDRSKQLLCDDCVSRLIELFDLSEHYKELEEQHSKGEEHQSEVGIFANCQEQDENHEESLCSDNRDDVLDTTIEAEGSNDNYVVESTEVHFNLDEDCEASVENNEQQFYIQANNGRSQECSNQSDFVDESHNEDDAQDLENSSDSVEIELEHGLAHHITEAQDYVDVVHNDEDNGGVLLANLDAEKNENTEYAEVIVEQFEYVDNEYFQLEEIQAAPSEASHIADVIQEEEYYEEYDDNTMDVIEENVADDIIAIEEEYLIEENICSQEYDSVDLAEYLDMAIITKFEELDLPWTIECRICLGTYNTFQELLKHPCVQEVSDEMRYSCIIKDCDEVERDMKSLARHLLIKHHDNIESLAIYGRCPECQKAFSNIVDLNKHSCCVFKRKAGIRHYCQACNMDFQSLKRFVFHMQYHLTKHRPKLCLLCGSSFNNVIDFFEHVSYSHESPSAMACVKCDRFFKDKAVYDRHIQCHELKTLFECSYCPKTYTNRCGLTSHMEIYHNHKTKPMQCEYCNKEFVSQSSYRSHMKVHMPEVNVPAYVCSICGLVSNNPDSIKNHIETDEEPSHGAVGEVMEEIISVAYACENCSLDFFSALQLHLHRQSSNHNSKMFYCPICRKVFGTLQHMRNHMTNHKDYDQWNSSFPIARFYMCDIGNCRDAYPLWTSLYYHKKRHKKASSATSSQEDDQYKCQFCEKLCPTKMSLAIHVARVHNNSHVKCSHCKKMYKTDKDLKQHIDHMHTSIECSKCQRLFKNRRNLLSHEQLVHKNEKRYFCGHCSKGYYYKSEMEAHEKNVHPDISYNCDLCHFITNYAKSLDIHMAKHNNQLPYKCSICSKAFGRKQLLSVHEKRHQKDKEFVCYDYCEDGCDASFVTHFLLKKHIQRKHSDANQEKQKKHLPKRIKNSTKNNIGPIIVVEEDDSSCVEYEDEDCLDDDAAEDQDEREYMEENIDMETGS